MIKKEGTEFSDFKCEPGDVKAKLVMKMRFNKLTESTIVTVKNRLKRQIRLTLDLSECASVECTEEESRLTKFVKSKQTEQFGSVLGLLPEEYGSIKVKVQVEDKKG